MNRSKPYSSVPVNLVVPDNLTQDRNACSLVVGFDVGKFDLLAVPRWGLRDFDKPWRIANPFQIPDAVRLLRCEGRRSIWCEHSVWSRRPVQRRGTVNPR